MSFSDENRKLYQKLHRSVLFLGWILVPIIFALEIVLLLVQLRGDDGGSNVFLLRFKMALPTAINLWAMIVTTAVINSDTIKLRIKNWFSTFSIFIILATVAIIHRDIQFLIILPCLAVLFSTIHADRLLFIVISVCNAFVIVFSLVLLIVGGSFTVNFAVAYSITVAVVIACTFFISNMMLKNAGEYRNLVRNAYSDQEELIDELHIEPMTGLSNRTSLNEMILAYIQKYHNGECVPHLVLMDIDHFKTINDTYGHNSGDIVIKNLASIIRKNMKGVSHAFRFGGDEMVLIFGKESLDEIKQIIENIRTEFKSTKYNFHPDHQITISVGCAPFYKGLNQKTWFELADAVMYKSKEGGRDTVSFADE